jgi:hypothetical protein
MFRDSNSQHHHIDTRFQPSFFSKRTIANMRFSIVSAVCFAATAIAAPVVEIRQSSTECGNNYYSASQVNAAFNQGLNYYYDSEQVGSDDYPHQYNNYEVCRGDKGHRRLVMLMILLQGFDFPVDGPYQEFPIKENGVYTGGKQTSDMDLMDVANMLSRLARC